MPIRRRLMPGTDLDLSVISLGSVPFGGDVSEDDTFRLLDAYAELGGNFIDTAEVYSNWLPGEPSRAERRIGKWLRSRGLAGRVTVATKGGHPRLDTMHVMRLSPQEIKEDIEGSLARLGLDQIPLYYLHRDDPSRSVGEMMDVLAEAVAAGCVRYLACSNWRPERIRAAQEYAAQRGRPRFVADQVRWSLARVNPKSQKDPGLVEMDDELYEYQRTSGLAAVAYSSQAQGFFSGAYGREAGRPRTPKAKKIKAYYYNEQNFRRLERVMELSRRLGRAPTQVALAYLLNQPFAAYAIIGCSSLEHLRESAGAHDIELAPAQVRWLDSG